MRTLCYTLAALTLLPLGCHRNAAETSSLEVFVVSPELIELDGARYIDVPGFRNLGYIGPKPDLVITRLEAVNPNPSAPPGQAMEGVVLTLRAEDAQKLAKLTETAVGKKLLFQSANIPVATLTLASPLDTSQAHNLALTLTGQTGLQSRLKQLTH